MSSNKAFSGLRWLISIPPRLFDWAMNNKIKTLLLIGAALYVRGEIRYKAERRADRREEVRMQQKAYQEELARQERVKKNHFDQMTFQNMPPPETPKPSAEELKKMEEQRQQALFEEKVMQDVGNYSFTSKPMLSKEPVPPEWAKGESR